MAVRDTMQEAVIDAVTVRILVGTDGLAKSMSIAGKLPPRLGQYMVQAAMVQKFKPAMCRGAPCEMLYLIPYAFQ
jgi:hypothetical protein